MELFFHRLVNRRKLKQVHSSVFCFCMATGLPTAQTEDGNPVI